MILKELLITNKGEFIKIGSEKGLFMYAGKVEDMARKLQYIDETYIDYYEKKYNKHKKQYERFKTPDLKKERNKCAPALGALRKKGKEITLEKYIKLRVKEELEETEKWYYRLTNYKPLMIREVKQLYGSLLHKTCMIAIVEGYDLGDRYDIEEEERKEYDS